jgi:hypothetical protein
MGVDMRVRVNMDVAASMHRSVMDGWPVNMSSTVTYSMRVTVMTSHESGRQKEAKTQQEAENEDQGKRIGRDHRLPSFRGNTCLIPPHFRWGLIP